MVAAPQATSSSDTEFEELAQKNSNFKTVFTINEATPDWNGTVGMITADMIQTGTAGLHRLHFLRLRSAADG